MRMEWIMIQQFKRCYGDVRKSKLKLNKDKCHFRCMSILFFGKVISREGV